MGTQLEKLNHVESEQIVRTDHLCVSTGFVMGMGSVLNVAGNYFPFNTSDSPEEADFKALQSDWIVVGQDIQSAIDKAAIMFSKNLETYSK